MGAINFHNDPYLQLIASHNELIMRSAELMWNYTPIHGKRTWEEKGQAQDFHKSDCRYRLCLGGKRGGKTYASTWEGVALALGMHPYKKIPIPNTGWIVGLNYAQNLIPINKEKYIDKFIPARLIKSWDEQSHRYTLINGSTITFKSLANGPTSMQSETVDWVHIDEEPDYDSFRAIAARLMERNGYCWISATPENLQSWLYDEIVMSEDYAKKIVWETFEFFTEDNSAISREGIKSFKSLGLGDGYEKRSLQGSPETVDSNRVFPDDMIPYAEEMIAKPKWWGDIHTPNYSTILRVEGEGVETDTETNGFYVWEEPDKKCQYIVSVDPSETEGGDPMALGVFKITGQTISNKAGLEMVAMFNKKIPIEQSPKIIWAIAQTYNHAFVVIESNRGMLPITIMMERRYWNQYKRTNNENVSKYGFATTAQSKQKIIDQLKLFLRNKKIWIYSKETFSQLKYYIKDKNGRMKGQFKRHDDLVMMLAFAVEAYVSGQYVTPIIEEDDFIPIPEKKRRGDKEDGEDEDDYDGGTETDTDGETDDVYYYSPRGY